MKKQLKNIQFHFLKKVSVTKTRQCFDVTQTGGESAFVGDYFKQRVNLKLESNSEEEVSKINSLLVFVFMDLSTRRIKIINGLNL